MCFMVCTLLLTQPKLQPYLIKITHNKSQKNSTTKEANQCKIWLEIKIQQFNNLTFLFSKPYTEFGLHNCSSPYLSKK